MLFPFAFVFRFIEGAGNVESLEKACLENDIQKKKKKKNININI